MWEKKNSYGFRKEILESFQNFITPLKPEAYAPELLKANRVRAKSSRVAAKRIQMPSRNLSHLPGSFSRLT